MGVYAGADRRSIAPAKQQEVCPYYFKKSIEVWVFMQDRAGRTMGLAKQQEVCPYYFKKSIEVWVFMQDRAGRTMGLAKQQDVSPSPISLR